MRTRSGRTQISESGLHLIDGTPFGKQQQPSRKINRPLVRIPQPQPQPEPVLLLGNGSEVGQKAEEEDITSSQANKHARPLLDDKGYEDLGTSKRKLAEFREDERPNGDDNGSLKRRRSVKFAESSTHSRGNQSATARVSKANRQLDVDDYDTTDDDDDDDFQPVSDSSDTNEVDEDNEAAFGEDVSSSESGETECSQDSSSSYISSSSSSSTSSSSSATSEVDNVDGEKEKPPFQKASSRNIPVPKKADHLAASLKGSHSTRGTSKKGSVNPGDGLRKTVIRNRRRRDAKRLRYLKSTGILHREATLSDLNDFNEELSKTGEQAALLDMARNRGQKNAQSATGDGQPKPEAQDQGQTNSITPTSNATSTNLPSGSSSTIKNNDVTSITNPLQAKLSSPLSDQDTKPTVRTPKLDVDSSRRMVFGSLGYRVPKNAADEERIRAKIVTSAKRNPVHNPAAAAQPTVSKDFVQITPKEYPEDPEYWKQKISLSAIECCDERLELSEPPFPFKQRWYKQQFQRSASKAISAGKKRKRKGQQSVDQIVNGVNGDQTFTDKIVLNYDDGDDGEEGTKNNTNGNATINGNITTTTIDLPSLPDDPTSLPIPTSRDLIPGAILAFKSLELSSATHWEPRISAYKVARLEDTTSSPTSEGESKINGEEQSRNPYELTLELAQRDSSPRKMVRFDDKGRRLYAKFEMEGYDEDEDDDDDDCDPNTFTNSEGDEGDEEEEEDDDDDQEQAVINTQTRRSRNNRGKKMVVMRDELVDLRLLRAASESA